MWRQLNWLCLRSPCVVPRTREPSCSCIHGVSGLGGINFGHLVQGLNTMTKPCLLSHLNHFYSKVPFFNKACSQGAPAVVKSAP